MMTAEPKQIPRAAPPKPLSLLLSAIAALGIFLRLRIYLANPSLFLDEAQLALNLLQRPFSDLAGRLEYDQVAPLGFLAVQKLSLAVFGGSEFALRLFPLLCSCGALLLFVRLAAKMLPPGGALVAAAVMSFSDSLLRFAVEAKQYGIDVLFSVLLLAAWRTYSEQPSRRELIALAALFFIAPWFSYPAVFVSFGVGVALLVEYRRKLSGLDYGLLGAAAGASIAANLAGAAARGDWGNDYLRGFWRSGFVPLGAPLGELIGWLQSSGVDFFRLAGDYRYYPHGELYAGAVIGILAVCGAAQGWRSCRGFVVLTAAVLGAHLCCAALSFYPFADRLVIYLLPLLFILVGLGAWRIQESLVRAGEAAPGICFVLLLSPFMGIALQKAIAPDKTSAVQELRPVLEQFRELRRLGDAVYVYYGAVPAFQYYAGRLGIPRDGVVWGQPSRGRWERYLRTLRQLAGGTRLWVVFTHVNKYSEPNEEDFMLRALDKIGRRSKELLAPGAALYLYDFSQPEGDK